MRFPLLQIARIAWPVTSLGPGSRIALWTSGCSHRCPGCISPELLDPSSGTTVSTNIAANRILSIPAEVRGLTVSGGDPADQAISVSDLLRQLRAAKPNWDVILYSGWTREQLALDPHGKGRVLEVVDLLIDGLYKHNIASNNSLAGSGNQRLHCLTLSGEKILQDMKCSASPFNLGLSSTGHELLIGIGTNASRKAIHNELDLSSI